LLAAEQYAHLVIAIPVWIESWAYQCCGERRSVGDAVTLSVGLAGLTEASDEPHSMRAEPDGSVRIVGRITGQAGNDHDSTSVPLVECGTLQFAATRSAGRTGNLLCTGTLWETGHGFAGGVTSGRLLGIRWHPALLRRTGEREYVVDGYTAGRELRCTDDWPRDDADDWALELSLWVTP
jgi:hypothetical protein